MRGGLRVVGLLLVLCALLAVALSFLSDGGGLGLPASGVENETAGRGNDAPTSAETSPVAETDRVELPRRSGQARPASEAAEGAGPLEVLEPDPPEEIVDAESLPDPLQVGSCMLEMTLVDAAEGAPMASHVDLWRLDAPANEHWSAGAQLHASRNVPVDGHLFGGLPEGRYLAVVQAMAHGVELPVLEVQGGRTRVRLVCERPGMVEVALRVFDRWGQPILKGIVEEGQPTLVPLDEPWRFERVPRGGAFVSFEGQPLFSSDREPARVLHADPETGLFELGSFQRPTRSDGTRSNLRLRTAGGAEVRISVPAAKAGRVEFTALAVPVGELAARVRLASGAPAPAEVEAWGEAVQGPAQAWREAPLRVAIRLVGHLEEDLTWTAGQDGLPWVVLRPAP